MCQLYEIMINHDHKASVEQYANRNELNSLSQPFLSYDTLQSFTSPILISHPMLQRFVESTIITDFS